MLVCTLSQELAPLFEGKSEVVGGSAYRMIYLKMDRVELYALWPNLRPGEHNCRYLTEKCHANA